MSPGHLSPEAKRLLTAVRAAPGSTLSTLCRKAKMGWSTLYRALHALEDADLARAKKRGRHTLVYPAESFPARKNAFSHAVLLQGATVRDIATRISNKPGQDMESLAEHFGLTPRVVYYHLRRLLEGKLIKSSSTTRYRDLVPTPALEEALAATAKSAQAKKRVPTRGGPDARRGEP